MKRSSGPGDASTLASELARLEEIVRKLVEGITQAAGKGVNGRRGRCAQETPGLLGGCGKCVPRSFKHVAKENVQVVVTLVKRDPAM